MKLVVSVYEIKDKWMKKGRERGQGDGRERRGSFFALLALAPHIGNCDTAPHGTATPDHFSLREHCPQLQKVCPSLVHADRQQLQMKGGIQI